MSDFPDYKLHVVKPISFDTMEDKIRNREYLTLEAILQDMKWLVHNSALYNGAFNKLTIVAKKLLGLFKTDLDEIDVCSDCYVNYMKSTSVDTSEKIYWFSALCVRLVF